MKVYPSQQVQMQSTGQHHGAEDDVKRCHVTAMQREAARFTQDLATPASRAIT